MFNWTSYHHQRFNPYAAGGKFGQYKRIQKITETLANGYSSQSILEIFEEEMLTRS